MKLLTVKELEDRAMRNIRNYEGNRQEAQRPETGRNYAGAAVQAFGNLSFTLTAHLMEATIFFSCISTAPFFFTLGLAASFTSTTI